MNGPKNEGRSHLGWHVSQSTLPPHLDTAQQGPARLHNLAETLCKVILLFLGHQSTLLGHAKLAEWLTL